jgi:nitroreductase
MYRNKTLTKAILRSQRCQRNWDLSYEIPAEDIEVIETAVTACPSKQNVTFYKPYFITKRDHIEKIHASSMGAYAHHKETGKGQYVTNAQLLANLLVVLVEDIDPKQLDRNPQIKSYYNRKLLDTEFEMESMMSSPDEVEMKSIHIKDFERDRNIAVGIASGYMNLTASLMGYSTGCCQCFDTSVVKEILGTKNDVLLIMGIGMKDQDRPRREHHLDSSLIFKTNNKNIEVAVV